MARFWIHFKDKVMGTGSERKESKNKQLKDFGFNSWKDGVVIYPEEEGGRKK